MWGREFFLGCFHTPEIKVSELLEIFSFGKLCFIGMWIYRIQISSDCRLFVSWKRRWPMHWVYYGIRTAPLHFIRLHHHTLSRNCGVTGANKSDVKSNKAVRTPINARQRCDITKRITWAPALPLHYNLIPKLCLTTVIWHGALPAGRIVQCLELVYAWIKVGECYPCSVFTSASSGHYCWEPLLLDNS